MKLSVEDIITAGDVKIIEDTPNSQPNALEIQTVEDVALNESLTQ
ncbi:MAG: hypothetical protein QXQ53_01155 [Candidatus Methanosuratincola sp.]